MIPTELASVVDEESMSDMRSIDDEGLYIGAHGLHIAGSVYTAGEAYVTVEEQFVANEQARSRFVCDGSVKSIGYQNTTIESSVSIPQLSLSTYSNPVGFAKHIEGNETIEVENEASVFEIDCLVLFSGECMGIVDELDKFDYSCYDTLRIVGSETEPASVSVCIKNLIIL